MDEQRKTPEQQRKFWEQMLLAAVEDPHLPPAESPKKSPTSARPATSETAFMAELDQLAAERRESLRRLTLPADGVALVLSDLVGLFQTIYPEGKSGEAIRPLFRLLVLWGTALGIDAEGLDVPRAAMFAQWDQPNGKKDAR